VGKRHRKPDPKLEAALDELDAALTADAMGEILQDLLETDEVVSVDPKPILPAHRSDVRIRRKR